MIMALRITPLRASLHAERVNTLFRSSPERLHSCICDQRRGKKSLTKSSSVKVKLLEDIPKYGRRGSKTLPRTEIPPIVLTYWLIRRDCARRARSHAQRLVSQAQSRLHDRYTSPRLEAAGRSSGKRLQLPARSSRRRPRTRGI